MLTRAAIAVAWSILLSAAGSGCSRAKIYDQPFRLPAAHGGDAEHSADAGAVPDAAVPSADVEAAQAAATDAAQAPDPIVPTSAYPRLSHRQWASAVRDLLQLSDAPDVTQLSADPASGTGFDNTDDRLEVAPNLWTDYQTLTESIAARVAADPAQLAKLEPGKKSKDPNQRASAFIAALGERAFRRPLTDSEQAPLLAMFQGASKLFPDKDVFAAGAELTIAAILQAPQFLYLIENAHVAGPDGVADRSDREIATRLAFVLWDSLPDAALTREASEERLHTPEQIAQQVERMLQLPQAADKLLEFHRQWLDMRRYDAVHIADLPENIGSTLRAESEKFVRATLLDEPGTFEDLFTSTTAFVNHDLAPLYGVSGEFGDELVRTTLNPEQRAGFLTRLGFLIATGGETAPIHRGVFIARKLLCATLPPPPMVTRAEMKGVTRRERVDSITGKGTCGEGCHAHIINPAGYPLEYFDDDGRYRTHDNGEDVDGTGSYSLSDGMKSFNGPVEWSRVFALSHEAHECFAKNLLMFSLGRAYTADDAALVTRMANASRVDSMPVRQLIEFLTQSPGFRSRKSEAP